MNTRTEQLTRDFAGELVKLGTGVPGLQRLMPGEVIAEGDEPVITFVASTSALDRYDEVIEQNGWELGNYLKNPVFQRDHNYSILCTLGKATEVKVKGGRLMMTIRFATEINEQARWAYEMFKGGYLNAVSVGFIPIEWQNGTQEAGYRRKFLKQELLELSAVAIPANPEALQQETFQPQRSDSGDATATAQARDLAELLELTRKLNQP